MAVASKEPSEYFDIFERIEFINLSGQVVSVSFPFPVSVMFRHTLVVVKGIVLLSEIDPLSASFNTHSLVIILCYFARTLENKGRCMIRSIKSCSRVSFFLLASFGIGFHSYLLPATLVILKGELL